MCHPRPGPPYGAPLSNNVTHELCGSFPNTDRYRKIQTSAIPAGYHKAARKKQASREIMLLNQQDGVYKNIDSLVKQTSNMLTIKRGRF